MAHLTEVPIHRRTPLAIKALQRLRRHYSPQDLQRIRYRYWRSDPYHSTFRTSGRDMPCIHALFAMTMFITPPNFMCFGMGVYPYGIPPINDVDSTPTGINCTNLSIGTRSGMPHRHAGHMIGILSGFRRYCHSASGAVLDM